MGKTNPSVTSKLPKGHTLEERIKELEEMKITHKDHKVSMNLINGVLRMLKLIDNDRYQSLGVNPFNRSH